MRTDAALHSVLGRNASVFMAVRGWVVRILVVSACLGMCTFSIFSLLELKPSQRYVREAQMLAKAAQKAAASTSRRPVQTPSTTPLEEGDQEYSQVMESVPYERQPSAFCVIYDFWNATEEYKFGEHVTLVLHATPEFVTYITEQVNTWDGGISVALFIPSPKHAPEIGEDAAAPNFYLKAVLAVLSKLETARASGKVGLHLFFDKNGFDKCPTLYLPTDTTDISIEEADMQYFTQVSKIYPINAARNIARIGSKTKLFLSGDIENIFCVNYEPRIYPLAKKLILDDKQQAVLIHRRFEIDLHSAMPRNKAELNKLYKKGKAVQFHKKFFASGHKIPHMSSWFKSKENPQHASVSFAMKYDNPYWEPQFVGDARVPFHDESFPFRFRTNSHLAYEMCRADFTFLVVNDLFTVHRGIKRSQSDAEKQAIRLAQKHYRHIVSEFKHRIETQYPNTTNTCAKFQTW